MSQIKVIFNYKGKTTQITCKNTEIMSNICDRFASEIKESVNNINFKYNGNLINKKIKLIDQLDEINKELNTIEIMIEEIDKKELNNSEEKISGKNKGNNDEFKMKIENDKLSEKDNNNYIISEIEITEFDIDKDIKIINSYEQFKREEEMKDNDDDYKYENEKELKEKCEIEINKTSIPFNYFYKFKEKGKYIVKYIFKENITKTSYMLYGCNFIININLSNFNTCNVINMSHMFSECDSLINLIFQKI